MAGFDQKGLVRVEGERKLQQALETMKKSTQNRVIRPAITAGARVIVRHAKRNARGVGRTKIYAKAVKSVTRTYQDAVVAVVGMDRSVKHPVTGNRPANTIFPIEAGQKPHTITARKVGVLSNLSTVANAAELSKTGTTGEPVVFGKQVQHPGAQARPIFAPAFRSGNAEAFRKIASTADTKLAALAAKAAKR